MTYDATNDRQIIAEELGREPRGKTEVVARCNDGKPLVIKVEPLLDDKPFLTLFWLTSRRLHKAISQIEADGGVERIRQQIVQSREYLLQYRFEHLFYTHLRIQSLPPIQVPDNYKQVIYNSGIGGMTKFTEVKCLHLHYAYHLVTPTLIGSMIDEKMRLH